MPKKTKQTKANRSYKALVKSYRREDRGAVPMAVQDAGSATPAPTSGTAAFGWTLGRAPLPSDKQVGLALGAHYLAASVCGHDRPAVPWPCEACLDRCREVLERQRAAWGF